MIENKEGRMKEMKEEKRNREVKCLVWDEIKKEIEIAEFPPIGRLYVTNTIEFSFSKTFINDLEEIMKKHSLEQLIESGLITIFISKDDELVFREKYIHIKESELREGDYVIKFSLRKKKAEEDIIATPVSYWLAVGEAFVWKGDKPSAPAHSTPAPRPERRGNRQVRVSRR